jgi:hypothetical protein
MVQREELTGGTWAGLAVLASCGAVATPGAAHVLKVVEGLGGSDGALAGVLALGSGCEGR